jgi:signal transduction histidine kinase
MIVVGLLFLAYFSLIKDGYRKNINKIFAGFSVLVGFWILSNNISNDTRLSSEIALYSNYIVFASSYGASILLAQFIANLSGFRGLERLIRKFLPFEWMLCLVGATPLVVSSVQLQGSVYAVGFGPLIWLYALGLFFTVGQMIVGIVYGLRNSKGLKRKQVLSVSVGMLITIPLVVLLSFVIPALTGLFYVTEFGISPGVILVTCLYYSVVKYRLLDVRLAFVRLMAYLLSLLVFVLFYYILAYVISFLVFDNKAIFNISNSLSVVVALVLASFFRPIKKAFDKLSKMVFYKDNYDSADFFAILNQTATVTNNLRVLLANSAREIEEIIKIDKVFFVVFRDNGNFMISSNGKMMNCLDYNTASLTKQFELDRDYLIRKDNLSLDRLDHQTKRLLISHKLELIIPLTVSKKIVGILCLGDKKSGRYTSRDINVLKTVSDELSIAIQNALAIQEIRDLNDSLQQKISNATKELRASNAQLQRLDKAKDEFVSMASHQLRTPLTTVKGYISMVVEGDAGEITSEQRRLLDEAFMSSERMVNLINDFLNVSRIQTGKFLIDKHETNLGELVKQEIDRLKSNADSRKLEFIYKKPKDFPIMNIDEAKIREVVMNFADNALYYSHEGAKIDVKLHVDENNQAIFEIIDTGIGVSLEDQSRLFTKFYRASNAKRQRPDGTGVGLFLAKKVISAHGGKVLFSSVEGKGSTFGFSLPVE